MKNYLALAATNNKKSINKELIKYVTSKIEGNVNIIDLNDFECPLFSPEIQEKNGIPPKAEEFSNLIKDSDGIIISFAEYNGSYTPVFKNIVDWASINQEKLWQHKPMLLMATSPGARGGQTVLDGAASYFPFMNGKVCGKFIFPSFYKNFSDGEITNPELEKLLETEIQNFLNEKELITKKETKKIEPFKLAGEIFSYLGYALLLSIVGINFFAPEILNYWMQNILWEIALIAACFTLVIRPIYEFIPHPIIEKMLIWRKGIGLISSSIVIGFWISRNIVPLDLDHFLSYFSARNWTFENLKLIARASEITGFILFFASNKWLVENFNTLWRWMQKTAYIYFLAGGFYVYLVAEKNYALVLLTIFFVIYTPFCIKLLFTKKDSSGSRHSQAS